MIFRKSIKKIQVWLISDKKYGDFTWRLYMKTLHDDFTWILYMKTFHEDFTRRLYTKTLHEYFKWRLYMKTLHEDFTWRLYTKTLHEDFTWRLYMKTLHEDFTRRLYMKTLHEDWCTFVIIKGKTVPLQAWSGPEVSRKLRFPDFMTTAHDGGKVVSLTHRPPLPSGNTSGIHSC